MTKTLGLGIDIGGTKIATAVFSDAGEALAFKRIDTASLRQDDPVADITDTLQCWLNEHQRGKVVCISVAAPGHPGDTGEFSPNNPNWSFHRMIEALSKAWPEADVRGINDVKAACYAEYQLGGWHARSLLHFNLGTGFSAGAVIDGHLLQGAHHMAMELGYLIPSLYPMGTSAAKGARSGVAPVEDMISGAGLRAQLDLAGFRQHQAIEVLRAKEDDSLWPLHNTFIEEFGRVICNTAITLDPDVMTIGGGLAPFCTDLIPELQSLIDEFLPCPVSIHVSHVARHGALLGAVILAWERMKVEIKQVPEALINGLVEQADESN